MALLRHGVVPDLVTMGKPMGNGLPIAAMVARADVLDAFARVVPYFDTFGGNPVTVAAAGAVLDVIERDKLLVNAAEVGGRLRQELTRLARDRPRIGDVRGDSTSVSKSCARQAHPTAPVPARWSTPCGRGAC